MTTDSGIPSVTDTMKLQQEADQKERDRVLDYRSETRQRVDTLIKAIFVLSGGALTISIGIFLRPDHPLLDDGHTAMLHRSWACFFTALLCGALLMFIMILQGYWESAIWDRMIRSPTSAALRTMRGRGLLQVANWVLGAVGFTAFLVGFLYLALVSVSASPPMTH